MQLTWQDAVHRKIDFEVMRALPNYGDLWDCISEEITPDDVEAGYADNRFDYEYGSIRGVGGSIDLEVEGGEGEVTVTFDCIEEEGCPEEDTGNITVSIDKPLSRREARRIRAHDECDWPTEDVSVEIKITRKSLTVEECTVDLRGEPLTYFRYTATYAWTTTGNVEGA